MARVVVTWRRVETTNHKPIDHYFNAFKYSYITYPIINKPQPVVTVPLFGV